MQNVIKQQRKSFFRCKVDRITRMKMLLKRGYMYIYGEFNGTF